MFSTTEDYVNEPNKWNIIIDTLRGGYVESQSRVRAVLVDAQGQILMQAGDPRAPTFWRSTAKFVQALSLFSSGAVSRFSFGDRELALACASHSGGPAHVALAQSMLDRISATVHDLHCGPHTPLGTEEAKQLAAEQRTPTKLHNNCSGKHAAMLASCRAHGFPLSDYNRHHHPLQQEILSHLAHVSETPPENIQLAVDGCGAVVFRTPLVGLALSYARFFSGTLPEPHREAGQRLKTAILAHPELVAGPGRLCTDLMQVSMGKLIAKVGADGVYALGGELPDSGPCGLAVKIEDGNQRLIGPLVCKLAAALGFLNDSQFQKLRSHTYYPIVNHQKELVGDVRVRIDD
jgi:L-asparaginase II